MFLRHMQRLGSALAEGKHQHEGVINNTMSIINGNSAKLGNIFKESMFGPTTDKVTEGLDLSGKTCIITGGNCGIGLEIVRSLLSINCDVIMACRNRYALKKVSDVLGIKNVERLKVHPIDLCSLNTVKEFCNEVKSYDKEIDILVLNAAVLGIPRTLTKDGLETTIQVNYLSQYYMLMELEHILADDARVIWLSSEAHRKVKWTDKETVVPTPELLSLPREKYDPLKAYYISKLCGLLSMQYLSYRWGKSSRSIFCANPGTFIKTNLGRNWWIYDFMCTYMKYFCKPIIHAAATPVFCATSPKLRGRTGIYFKNCEACKESSLANDFHLAVRINDLSRSIICDHFKPAYQMNKTESEAEIKEPIKSIKQEVDTATMLKQYRQFV